MANFSPRITDDFHSLSDASWYIAAYTVAITSLQPTWGKVYQIFSLKIVCITSALFFLIGSLICAIASNSTVFILGRTIAGIGAGGVYPGNLTILAVAVPLERRSTFTGLLTSIFAVPTMIVQCTNIEISAFLGPMLGGVFTDKVTWRWCFLISLPLGVLVIVGTVMILKLPAQLIPATTIKTRLGELDYIGPIFFIPANICLLLAASWGGVKFPWSSPTIVGLFCGFAVLSSIWLYSQLRLKEKATIPSRIFLQRTAFFSSIFGFFATSAMAIPQFYFPLYLQAVKGESAIASGVYMLPYVAALTVSSIVAGLLLTRVGYCSPFMITGGGLLAIGGGLLATIGVNTTDGHWVGYQIISGFGAGMSLHVSPTNGISNEDTSNGYAIHSS